jgi:hypothetical protein
MLLFSRPTLLGRRFMRRTIVLIIIVAAIISFSCGSRRNALSEWQINANLFITGRVLDVHMAGEIKEEAIVCSPDAHYIVAIKTENGVKKLLIHSPAKTFMGADPVGKNYRFRLTKSDKHFLLEKAEEIP